jgi:hypothetical protein
MKKIIEFSVNDIKLARNEVLEAQGIPSGKEVSENVENLYHEAMDNFLKCAHPVGIISEISIPEFEIVYKGEGLNEKTTPLNNIFGKADNLALFAVTIGDPITERIDNLFKSGRFALASMLDSAASAGTDKTADYIERYFFNRLKKRGEINSSTGILRYSPGYCGWHMSGQKKLFKFLHPRKIGIRLLDSFIMKPLKSISGVIVAGEKKIHKFKDSFPFCKQCTTHSCRARIKRLLRQK